MSESSDFRIKNSFKKRELYHKIFLQKQVEISGLIKLVQTELNMKFQKINLFTTRKLCLHLMAL